MKDKSPNAELLVTGSTLTWKNPCMFFFISVFSVLHIKSLGFQMSMETDEHSSGKKDTLNKLLWKAFLFSSVDLCDLKKSNF